MISSLRRIVQQNGKAEITAYEFDQLQAEWITRVGANELLADEREVSDKLEKALKQLSAKCDRARSLGQTPSDSEKAARAALYEVAALRATHTNREKAD